MKQVKFFAIIGVAAAAMFLSGCGSGDEKKTDQTVTDSSTTKTDTSTVKTETAAPAISAPSNIMTIKHKVANYAKWKPSFDAHDSVRESYGLHNYVVARGVEDSNMVLVALKMDDVNKAKELGTSKGMKDRMQKAGVIGPVTIDYKETLMSDTTAIAQTERLMINHKVKDWNAWKKSFDDHKQVRMDAGLTDRVVSHTVGDDHNVTLVFSVGDEAKAKAFINSKDLKDKMAEAGVEGKPTFFFYKVVQKY